MRDRVRCLKCALLEVETARCLVTGRVVRFFNTWRKCDAFRPHVPRHGNTMIDGWTYDEDMRREVFTPHERAFTKH